jgi:signal transduction histidine kinase
MYQFRIRQLRQQFNVAIEARVNERTRIARELHDTLLQSFQGLLLRFQAVSKLIAGRPEEAKQRVDFAIEQAAVAVTEGRDAVHELRSGGPKATDLSESIGNFGKELLDNPSVGSFPELRRVHQASPLVYVDRAEMQNWFGYVFLFTNQQI